MNPEARQKFDAIKDTRISQVAALYEELFDERCQSRNRQFLLRRIAWKLQARMEGGLSKKARLRAKAIASTAPIRTTSSDVNSGADLHQRSANSSVDRCDSTPGSLIEGAFQGRSFRVMVMDDGFEFESTRYVRLSDVAMQICGDREQAESFFANWKAS